MNKTYFLIFIVTISLFISGCASQVKCGSAEALNLAKQLIYKELNTEDNKIAFETYYADFKVDFESSLNHFIEKSIVIENIRTTESDEKLSKCNCSSQINFKFPIEFAELMRKNTDNEMEVENMLKKFSESIDFDYSLQVTDDNDKLFIEASVPTEALQPLLVSYLSTKTIYDKLNEKKTKDINSNSNANQLSISSAETLNFLRNNIGSEYCYEEITEKDENGVSAYRLKIRIISHNKIVGVLGYHPNIDVDSWSGDIEGTLKDGHIEGQYQYSSEGQNYDDQFKMYINSKGTKIIFEKSENNMVLDNDCKNYN